MAPKLLTIFLFYSVVLSTSGALHRSVLGARDRVHSTQLYKQFHELEQILKSHRRIPPHRDSSHIQIHAHDDPSGASRRGVERNLHRQNHRHAREGRISHQATRKSPSPHLPAPAGTPLPPTPLVEHDHRSPTLPSGLAGKWWTLRPPPLPTSPPDPPSPPCPSPPAPCPPHAPSPPPHPCSPPPGPSPPPPPCSPPDAPASPTLPPSPPPGPPSPPTTMIRLAIIGDSLMRDQFQYICGHHITNQTVVVNGRLQGSNSNYWHMEIPDDRDTTATCSGQWKGKQIQLSMAGVFTHRADFIADSKSVLETVSKLLGGDDPDWIYFNSVGLHRLHLMPARGWNLHWFSMEGELAATCRLFAARNIRTIFMTAHAVCESRYVDLWRSTVATYYAKDPHPPGSPPPIPQKLPAVPPAHRHLLWKMYSPSRDRHTTKITQSVSIANRVSHGSHPLSCAQWVKNQLAPIQEAVSASMLSVVNGSMVKDGDNDPAYPRLMRITDQLSSADSREEMCFEGALTGRGAEEIVQRERALMTPSSRPCGMASLVDGFHITQNRCSYTQDGRHYPKLAPQEVADALAYIDPDNPQETLTV